MLPLPIVSSLSKMHELGFVLMSVDTSGSVEYWRYGSSGALDAACSNAALTAGAAGSRARCTPKSVVEHGGTGARTEMPSTFPFSSGSTSPIARAAPVEVGIRLIAAARARRRSLCGRSRMLLSFVYAWIVVMNPRSIVNASCSTFAIGATQFVVHDALEMM